jgi:hypothetical protein
LIPFYPIDSEITPEDSFGAAHLFGRCVFSRLFGVDEKRRISPKLVNEMHRPADIRTSVPKYQSGLGFAIRELWSKRRQRRHIWMDPSLQLICIYLTHYFLGDFRDGNPAMNAAFPG